MPDLRISAGEYVNLAEYGKAITISGALTSDQGAPLSHLTDRRPATPHRVSSLSPGYPVTWSQDLDLVTNGTFETTFVSGLPAAAPVRYKTLGWTKTADATLTRDTVVFDAGLASLRVSGTASSYAAFDVPVRSGWRLNFTVRARGNAAGKTANLRIQNIETGMWLTSGLVWQTAVATYGTVTGTAFGTLANTLTVEGFSLTQSDKTVLRFYLRTDLSDGSQSYWDSFAVWPSVNAAALFGHNIPAGGVVEVVSGTNPASTPATVRGTLAVKQPAMWVAFAENTDRLWGFKISNLVTGTAPNPPNPDLGEWVLLQFDDLDLESVVQHPYRINWPVSTVMPQVRLQGSAREVFVHNLASQPSSDIVLPFKMMSEAEKLRIYEEIICRGNGGNAPVVLIPNTDLVHIYYCRLTGSYDRSEWMRTGASAEIRFEGMGYGLIGP